jgi:hypothetical protein
VEKDRYCHFGVIVPQPDDLLRVVCGKLSICQEMTQCDLILRLLRSDFLKYIIGRVDRKSFNVF